MSISGTRGLVRISKNPRCALQAAMAVDRENEPKFYESVTGEAYPGEYGEREAARRRGAKFEANLHQNNAALLRKALASAFAHDAEAMTVRNFAEEVTGGEEDGVSAIRLTRTRYVMVDLAAGKEVPDLLVHPQFALPAGRGSIVYVTPDFVVLDRAKRIYVPGDEKSFIARDNVVDSKDLDLTRRQAAAQVLALRAVATQLGIGSRVENRAAFVFATPFGLSPAPAVVESIEAEVHEMGRALETYARVHDLLTRLRKPTSVKLAQLVDEVPHHYQESCVGSCVMVNFCEKRHVGKASALGEDAAALLGADADLERLGRLLGGEPPSTPDERELVARIKKAAMALGLNETELTRKFA